MLLFLNDIAASEIMLVFLFILLFFGSKSIPGIARTMGKTIRQIKDASDEVKAEIQKSGMDMKKDMNLGAIIRETEEDLTRPLDQMASDMDQAMNGRGYTGRTRAPKVENAPLAGEMPVRNDEKEVTPEVSSEKMKDNTESLVKNQTDKKGQS